MAFYEALFPFYDQIFPLNKPAHGFLLELFQKGDVVLDVGAGTGSMAISLAEQGLKVTAIEPEAKMANAIQEKAARKELPVKVNTLRMEEVKQLTAGFDGIYCIGNTLPHLQSLEEISSFLTSCFEKLKPNGTIVLQTVNFDKVLSSTDFSFPLIEKEEFTFERKYEREGEKIRFTARITTKEQSFSNSLPLFPITAQQLTTLLQDAGFNEVQLFGNFKKDAHTVQSPAIVVMARK